MNILRALVLLAALTTATAACGADDAKSAADTFREPFTLKLHVDKEHFYEQAFGKVPYVHNNDVYLFKGEEFGLGLDVQGDVVRAVTYQPDLNKADVTLKFSQEINADGTAMMLLVIQNHTKQSLDMDALITVPGGKGAVETTILPVKPGLSGYESWPHPIVQLLLRNVRLSK